MILQEKYFGKKPFVSHLGIFGSLSFCHIPKGNRKKMDSKTQKYIYWNMTIQTKYIDYMSHKERKSYVVAM